MTNRSSPESRRAVLHFFGAPPFVRLFSGKDLHPAVFTCLLIRPHGRPGTNGSNAETHFSEAPQDGEI